MTKYLATVLVPTTMEVFARSDREAKSQVESRLARYRTDTDDDVAGKLLTMQREHVDQPDFLPAA